MSEWLTKIPPEVAEAATKGAAALARWLWGKVTGDDPTSMDLAEAAISAIKRRALNEAVRGALAEIDALRAEALRMGFELGVASEQLTDGAAAVVAAMHLAETSPTVPRLDIDIEIVHDMPTGPVDGEGEG